jgi:hypothetical protein
MKGYVTKDCWPLAASALLSPSLPSSTWGVPVPSSAQQDAEHYWCVTFSFSLRVQLTN